MSAVQGLKNVTVLIVRRAEKPDQGLTAHGELRGNAYASFFKPLKPDGIALQPQRLIATSDSKFSARPRLKLMLLAGRLGIPLEQSYVAKRVNDLRARYTAGVVLIV